MLQHNTLQMCDCLIAKERSESLSPFTLVFLFTMYPCICSQCIKLNVEGDLISHRTDPRTLLNKIKL